MLCGTYSIQSRYISPAVVLSSTCLTYDAYPELDFRPGMERTDQQPMGNHVYSKDASMVDETARDGA